MKDKEKQIEEMARIISNARDTYFGTSAGDGYYVPTQYYAKVLLEQGYRKLLEDSVVLSREKYREFLEMKRDMINNTQYKRGSKETAEKFAKELRNFIYLYDDLKLDADTYEKISNKMDELILERERIG